MWLTKVAIDRRVTISMVILFLLVMGITAFREMPWESDPDVEIPYISVFVPYPGAGPEEIEQRIIIPLEDAISVIEGVDSVSSTAFENGAQIVVGFELEVDQDVAASDVRDAPTAQAQFRTMRTRPRCTRSTSAPCPSSPWASRPSARPGTCES